MIICKNISSGKFFIYIKEIEWGKFEVVTPANKIKVLERHLFEDEIDGSRDVFLRAGLITEAQLNVYQDYERNRQEDWDGSFDEKSVSKKKIYQRITKRPEVITMKTIAIDDEVFAFLQSQAIPFVETNPNLVLRRLLLKKSFEQKAPGKSPIHTGIDLNRDDKIYEYRVGDAFAKMIIKDGSYVILKGSTAVKENKPSMPESSERKKRELISFRKLVLDEERNLYVFTEDVLFGSPSMASGVISGTSSNGRLCFNIK